MHLERFCFHIAACSFLIAALSPLHATKNGDEFSSLVRVSAKPSDKRQTEFTGLPDELLEHIFKYTSFEDARNIKLVSHRFYDVMSSVMFSKQYTAEEAFTWEALTEKSNPRSIIKLSLGRCQLEAFLEGSAISDRFSSVAPKIVELDLNLSRLSELKCKAISKEISSWRDGGSSFIPGDNLIAVGVGLVGEVLKKLTNLKALSISLLGDDGLHQSVVWNNLAKDLKGCKALKKLRIHHSPVKELIDAREYHNINAINSLKALDSLKKFPGIAVEFSEISSQDS